MAKLSAILLFVPLSLAGQDEQTRAGQIEAERHAKAATIAPTAPDSFGQKALSSLSSAFTIWNFTREGSHGLSLRLGGLAIGSGLALGPEYVYKAGELYNPNFIWDSFAVGSTQGYYKLQTGMELPRLANDHAYFSATAFRIDYPRLSFYGNGPDSRLTGHTDYRFQDNDIDVRGGIRLTSHLNVGALGAFQRISLLSGTDPGIAQASSTYHLPEAFGDHRGIDFFSGGFFAQFDDRDARLDPHAGTFLSSTFQNVNSSRGYLGGFNQYDLEAQHYFPYWNKRRVIATRVKSVLTTPHQNSIVPFYLEPRLGGSDDLRGFRPYRFYDRNSILATVEYRWTAMEKVDMALFADAGKVYHDADTFSLKHMQSDVGFGIRGRVSDNVPIRIDFGFSREGAQVWLSFYNVF